MCSTIFMIITYIFHCKGSTPSLQEERRNSHSQASTSEGPSNGDQPAHERVLARSKSLLDPQGVPVAASDDERPTSGDMGNGSRNTPQHAARGNGKPGSVHTQEQRVKDAVTVAGKKMQVSGACMHRISVTACLQRPAALCKADALLASQLEHAKRAPKGTSHSTQCPARVVVAHKKRGPLLVTRLLAAATHDVPC